MISPDPSIYPLKKTKITIVTILVFLTIWLSLSSWWALSQFAGLNMEELIYELSAPLEGTGNGMIGDYFLRCFLPAVFIAAAAAVILLHLKTTKKLRWGLRGTSLTCILCLFICIYVFSDRVHLISYLRHQTTSSDFIEQNYVDPSSVSIQFPEKKRNLIMIYLESVETTFSSVENGGAFDDNYIPNLTRLALENTCFNNEQNQLNGGYSLPGTTWTIAGMFAASSGLPLKSAMEDNAMSTQKSFFPNLTTLGDILAQQDYHQVLMLGSDATFGGRRVFYQDHGSFDIEDYKYAIAEGMIPEDYKEFWGYEDEKLFSFAKDRLTQLSQEDKPFNLTMLTVDTHMPKGYTCRLCRNQYGKDAPYANAVSCSDRQLYEFISWIQHQPFYENTTIVLTGDHPTMATGFCDSVPPQYERKTYTCIINADASETDMDKDRSYTILDLFPTTVAALGATVEGNRLGLGTNLFSAEPTLTEKNGYAVHAEEVAKNSPFLTSLERLDDTTQKAIQSFTDTPAPDITVDAAHNRITVSMPAIPSHGYKIRKAFIKLWLYDDEKYIHSIQYLEQQPDGSWSGDVDEFKVKKFLKYDAVHYQMYLTVSGSGSFAIGQENVLFMHPDTAASAQQQK